MKRVHSLSEKREQKIVQSAQDFIDDVMDGSASDEELDRRLDVILENWNQHKESEGMTMVVEKLYTPKEAAQDLGWAEKTVLDYLRAGKLPGVKMGREWRIKEKDLQAYVDALKRPHYVGSIRHLHNGNWKGKLTTFPFSERPPGEEAGEINTLHTTEEKVSKELVQQELLSYFKDLQKRGVIGEKEKMIFTITGGGRSSQKK
ncbi:MAG: helix-turn-helix domain-containing protein [Candidatus Xenobiia bacterium LiM19]